MIELGRLLPGVVLLVGLATTVQADRYVDDDAPPGGDGLTWDTAFTHLQDALSVVATYETIHIAGGTYRPDQSEYNFVELGDPTATFELPAWVTLLGGYAGRDAVDPDERDWLLYETVFSGDLAGDGEPPDAAVSDNTATIISVGSSAQVHGITLRGAVDTAMRIPSGHVTVRDCRFTRNDGSAGAIYTADYHYYSDLYDTNIIADCVFVQNRGRHAGACMFDGLVNLQGCYFVDNRSPGSGAVLVAALVRMQACTLIENRNVRGTQAYDVPAGAIGIGLSRGALLLHDSLLADNRARQGAAITQYGPWLDVQTSTIVDNTSLEGPAGILAIDGTTSLNSSILWNNSDPNGVGERSQFVGHGNTALYYNTIQGWSGILGGTGNDGRDPLFVDPAGGEYRLSAASPLIDAGGLSDPQWIIARTADLVDRDEDCRRFDEQVDTDLAGALRWFDQPLVPNTGDPNDVVDRGAYEFGAPVPGSCRGDVNNDGVVDLADLEIVLNEFGGWAFGDVDCDGRIFLNDLALLLSRFGTRCR